MTQTNNEKTKFLAIKDESSNYLPLMMAGAGLIGYTLYNKYKSNCSLNGKEINLVIETPGQSGNSKAVVQAIINKTVTKNVYSFCPNGELDEDGNKTWGTFNFFGQEFIIEEDGINTAEIVRAPNGNLSVTFLFGDVAMGINLPTLTYTLYPSKFNKNNFAGFTTSGSSLIAPGVTPPGAPFPVVENFLIAGKGKLKINH